MIWWDGMVFAWVFVIAVRLLVCRRGRGDYEVNNCFSQAGLALWDDCYLTQSIMIMIMITIR